MCTAVGVALAIGNVPDGRAPAAGLSEASTPLKPAKPEAEPKVAAEPNMGVGEEVACSIQSGHVSIKKHK